MELAICKAELPTNKFMLPTSAPAASFYDKTHHHHTSAASVHLNDILNFPSNYLFNKNSTNSANNCDNLNSSSITTTTTAPCASSLTGSTSTMRLKKNRKVTFLSNLIETKNIFIKEESVDGKKDLPPPICSISDISDHETSLDVPTQIPPLTPGTNRKVAEVLKASFASWEKEVQNCNITKDPREWSEEHVIYWLNWAIKEFSLVSMNHEPFLKMKGRDIIELGKDKFLAITPAFTGDILWEHLDILQKDCEKPSEDCNVNTSNSYETTTAAATITTSRSICGSDLQAGFRNNNNTNTTTSNNNTTTTASASNSSRITPQDFSTSTKTAAVIAAAASTSATSAAVTTITTTATSDKTTTSAAIAASTATIPGVQQHHSGKCKKSYS